MRRTASAWREHRHLRPDELAEAAGIDPHRLGRIETKSAQPTPDELVVLAEALGVEVDDLTDPPP